MVRTGMRITAVLLACALAGPARAEAPVASAAVEAPRSAVEVDWVVDGTVTGGALVVWLGSEALKDQLAPPACRWCAVNGFDSRVRDAVVWGDPSGAKTISDLLVIAVPLGAVAYDGIVMGSVRATLPDFLLIDEAIAVAGAVGQLTKFVTARQRPYAVYGTWPSQGIDDHLSFYSAHTSVAFAAAAAAGRLAQQRDDPYWPWVYGVGFSAAAATGYFRMAADKHWSTDVLMGAATGTAVGLAVPWLHQRRPGPLPIALAVAPRYVGVAGRF
jgi:membrane-associated phospholipid phosphatase